MLAALDDRQASALVEAVGAKDSELSRFVDASAAVLRTFAGEDRSLRATLHELPGALSHTAAAMGRVTRLTQVAGPALRHLRPTATRLGPGLRATVPVLRDTPRVITRRLDPFAAAAVPTLDELVPAARALRPLTASLSGAFGVFDRFLDALAYNPTSRRAGFLLYGAWASHNLNSVLSAQDAGGPMGRTLLLQDCDSRALLSAAAKTNPAVRLLLGLWDPPTQRQIGGCGSAAARLTRTPEARR